MHRYTLLAHRCFAAESVHTCSLSLQSSSVMTLLFSVLKSWQTSLTSGLCMNPVSGGHAATVQTQRETWCYWPKAKTACHYWLEEMLWCHIRLYSHNTRHADYTKRHGASPSSFPWLCNCSIKWECGPQLKGMLHQSAAIFWQRPQLVLVDNIISILWHFASAAVRFVLITI